MDNRITEIMDLIELAGINVSEEDLSTDIDSLADTACDTFWDEMYHDGDYDSAQELINNNTCESFRELSYIAEKLEDQNWDESEEYIDLCDLVFAEVFDRADIPTNEDDAQERMNEDEDLDSDEDEDI